MITKSWKPFVETGCICKSKTTELPSTDESTVEFLQQAYVQSPRKSRNRASRDLALPHKTVWHALWKWLHTVQTGQSKTLHSLFSICAIVYDQLFFVGLTMTGILYHEMLIKWLLLQFLNESISHHWIGQATDVLTSLKWLQTSPDLSWIFSVPCVEHREMWNIWYSIATKVA